MMLAHENEDLLAPSRQDAKFGILFLPLRLCVFARDIPAFGCGFAALGLCGEFFSTGNPE
jgi:hypothetical protein